jgi:hypothetical protein
MMEANMISEMTRLSPEEIYSSRNDQFLIMEAEKFFQTGLLLRIDVAVIQEDTVIRE